MGREREDGEMEEEEDVGEEWGRMGMRRRRLGRACCQAPSSWMHQLHVGERGTMHARVRVGTIGAGLEAND